MVYTNKINGLHYEGPPSVPSSNSSRPKINPKDYRSMQFYPITVPSWSRESSLPQKPHFVEINGKPYAMNTASSKIFLTPAEDYSRYGFFSQIDDLKFRDWLANGTEDYPNRPSNKPIPKMPDIDYVIVSKQLGLYLPHENDTKVDLRVTPRIVEAVDPNKIGYFESKIANRYEELRNALWDNANRLQDEAIARIEFLDKNGLHVKREEPLYGLGIENGDFFAAYYPKQRFLVYSQDFDKKVEELISKYGLDDKEAIEAMKRSISPSHEVFGHAAAQIGGDRPSEKLQGLLDAEFYSVMAERYKGTKKERIYRALAQEGRDYAKEYSFFNSILEELTAEPFPKEEEGPLELLVKKFEKEADAFELSGKCREAYVKSRLNDTYGPLLDGEPSYKSRDTNTSKNIIKAATNKDGKAYEKKSDETYESKSNVDGKSEYNSMSDAKKTYSKEKGSKSKGEQKDASNSGERESPQESETAESAEASGEGTSTAEAA